MIFSASGEAFAVDGVHEETPYYYEQMMALQSNAVAANELLSASFKISQNGTITYPDSFGGCYIDIDKLCVLVTGMDDLTLDYYRNIFGSYVEYVTFQKVDYSYNELSEESEVLAKSISRNGISVNCYYVSEVDNEIIIGVDSNDYNTAMQRRNAKSSTIPYRIIKSEPIESETTLVGGKKISNGAVELTLGICGRYNGYDAVLTCGHNLSVGDSITYLPTSEVIGTVTYKRYSVSYNGDFGIIKVTNTNMNLSNSIANTYSITGTYLTPAVNTVVKKYGANSGYAYGTVTQRNVSANDTKGLSVVKITYGTSQGGDSGGPYFITENSSNKFCGIHHGSNITTEEYENTGILKVYFTPYSYISPQGFTPKTT